MNFLDPEKWNDLESLEKEHEELTEELVKNLHERLRPYFLRRIKSEVLQLPPKVCDAILNLKLSSLIFVERSYCANFYGATAKRDLPLNIEYAKLEQCVQQLIV
jgi:hypothetical protein